MIITQVRKKNSGASLKQNILHFQTRHFNIKHYSGFHLSISGLPGEAQGVFPPKLHQQLCQGYERGADGCSVVMPAYHAFTDKHQTRVSLIPFYQKSHLSMCSGGNAALQKQGGALNMMETQINFIFIHNNLLNHTELHTNTM